MRVSGLTDSVLTVSIETLTKELRKGLLKNLPKGSDKPTVEEVEFSYRPKGLKSADASKKFHKSRSGGPSFAQPATAGFGNYGTSFIRINFFLQ